MVTSYTAIRAKLDRKLFQAIGMDVTHKIPSFTYDTRGEISSTSYTTETVKCVPYNTVSKNQSYEAFGALQAGDQDAAVPYSVTVNIDDVFVIDGVDWLVKNIQPNYLQQNVVTVVRLSRSQA